MDIEYFENNSFTYGKINNCLNKKEIKSLREIFNWLYPNLQSPEKTGSATDDDGKYKKKNLAYFLNETIPVHPLTQQLEQKYFKSIQKTNSQVRQDSVFYAALSTNWSGVLMSYYNKDDDGYKPHTDCSIITCIMWFDLFKKNFTGGDLYLPQIGVTIPPIHNTGVIIPGHMIHEVKPINIIDKNNSLGGRLAISIFCGHGSGGQ